MNNLVDSDGPTIFYNDYIVVNGRHCSPLLGWPIFNYHETIETFVQLPLFGRKIILGIFKFVFRGGLGCNRRNRPGLPRDVNLRRDGNRLVAELGAASC